MVTAHGLAASIQAAQESETFDLGGMTAESILTTIDAAFAAPFLDTAVTGDKMIRITLVTGAGKQARQKYDDGASRCVTTTLQKHGYVEDRGASCVLSSAGTYKLQHDTGKNIKTVVIFPKLKKAVAGGGEDTTNQKADETIESLLPENSPGYKLAVSSMNVFENMIESNCPSWSQKKGCLTCIEGIKELLQDLDGQLIKGTPLSESEQAFYDSVVHLEEKETIVRQLAQTQVEQGNITRFEKDLLLQQNAERIASLTKENKPTAKALERKTLLESIIDPISPHKLKHHAKIGKLYKELAPLLQIEADCKGRNLLSMKEATAMARKDEIEKEIQHLEEASRGWFEDDAVFESRVQTSRNEFATRWQQSTKQSKSYGGETKSVASKAASNTSGSVNKWVTPGESIRGGFSSLPADKKKSKKHTKGNHLFGAMMMDSSSDEEDQEQEIAAVVPKTTVSPGEDKPPASAATSEKAISKNKSKKKKKSKKAAAKGESDDEDDLLASLVEETKKQAAKEEEEEKNKSALGQLVGFIQVYILPLLVAVLGWIIEQLFGKPKKQKRK